MTREIARQRLGEARKSLAMTILEIVLAVAIGALMFAVWPVPPFPRGFVLALALLIVVIIILGARCAHYVSSINWLRRIWNL